MEIGAIKELLDQKYQQHNISSFVECDPVQIPRSFTTKEDIEIAAFLSATIAWGNRASVIKSAKRMMELLGNSPYDFIINHSDKDLRAIDDFIHRTFQPIDFLTFVKGLKHIYKTYGGLEQIFSENIKENCLHYSITEFKRKFFEIVHQPRTQKHIADPIGKGSHAKRMHLFLKWMVRKDNGGIDLGIWDSIPMSALSCPLDVHTGRIARKLGFITIKQDNLRALRQLDEVLRSFDPNDPAKYDIALFNLSKEGF